MDHHNDRFSFDAPENLDSMVEVLQQVALKDASEALALDQGTRWRQEDALERPKAREQAQGRPFSQREDTPVFAMASILISCLGNSYVFCAPL